MPFALAPPEEAKPHLKYGFDEELQQLWDWNPPTSTDMEEAAASSTHAAPASAQEALTEPDPSMTPNGKHKRRRKRVGRRPSSSPKVILQDGGSGVSTGDSAVKSAEILNVQLHALWARPPEPAVLESTATGSEEPIRNLLSSRSRSRSPRGPPRKKPKPLEPGLQKFDHKSPFTVTRDQARFANQIKKIISQMDG